MDSFLVILKDNTFYTRYRSQNFFNQQSPMIEWVILECKFFNEKIFRSHSGNLPVRIVTNTFILMSINPLPVSQSQRTVTKQLTVSSIIALSMEIFKLIIAFPWLDLIYHVRVIGNRLIGHWLHLSLTIGQC